MLSLRAEIAACLIAVSLLGLIVGWMMQRSRGARRLQRTVEALKKFHAETESSARQDVANLEDRLQLLAGEIRTLTDENRRFRGASDGDEMSLDTARAESLELSRRQIETQERLQRIIREREREIATLRAGLAGRDPARTAGIGSGADGANVAGGDGLDETVRLDPALLPVQLPGGMADFRADSRADIRSLHPTAPVVASASAPPASVSPLDDVSTLDDTLESTMDVAFLDAEEATIALDEETLSLVRGLGRGERKG